MADYEKMLDSHIKKYANATMAKDLTIDVMESLMVEANRAGGQIIKEVAEKVLQAAEPELVEKKKYAPIAVTS